MRVLHCNHVHSGSRAQNCAPGHNIVVDRQHSGEHLQGHFEENTAGKRTTAGEIRCPPSCTVFAQLQGHIGLALRRCAVPRGVKRRRRRVCRGRPPFRPPFWTTSRRNAVVRHQERVRAHNRGCGIARGDNRADIRPIRTEIAPEMSAHASFASPEAIN